MNISIISTKPKGLIASKQYGFPGDFMFKDIVGDTPEARILDFLLLHPHTSHNLSKIIEGTNLNFRTAQKKMENLIECGAVEVVHQDKKSKYYIIKMERLVAEFEKIADVWRQF